MVGYGFWVWNERFWIDFFLGLTRKYKRLLCSFLTFFLCRFWIRHRRPVSINPKFSAKNVVWRLSSGVSLHVALESICACQNASSLKFLQVKWVKMKQNVPFCVKSVKVWKWEVLRAFFCSSTLAFKNWKNLKIPQRNWTISPTFTQKLSSGFWKKFIWIPNEWFCFELFAGLNSIIFNSTQINLEGQMINIEIRIREDKNEGWKSSLIWI